MKKGRRETCAGHAIARVASFTGAVIRANGVGAGGAANRACVGASTLVDVCTQEKSGWERK